MKSADILNLKPRWVLANALGELIGLGGTFAILALLNPYLSSLEGTRGVWIGFAIAVAAGLVESAIVGNAQWWAMSPWTKPITRVAWWKATAVGAVIAYMLGYLPSTLMSAEQATSTPVAEPPLWQIIILAAGLGAIAALALSFMQQLELKKHYDKARKWIGANAIAWAVGMPLIFIGIDFSQRVNHIALAILIMAVTLLISGAVVGFIESVWLSEILTSGKPGTTQPYSLLRKFIRQSRVEDPKKK